MNRLYLEDVELGPDDGMEAVEDGGVVEAAHLEGGDPGEVLLGEHYAPGAGHSSRWGRLLTTLYMESSVRMGSNRERRGKVWWVLTYDSSVLSRSRTGHWKRRE